MMISSDPASFQCVEPRGFIPRRHSDAGWRSASTSADPSSESDAGAVSEAFAQGFAEGERTALAAMHDCQQQRDRLADAIERLSAISDDELGALLLSHVRRLLIDALGREPSDSGALAALCNDAAASVAAYYSDAQLFVSVADHALLAGQPLALPLAADPGLADGSIRIVHGAGELLFGSAATLSRLDTMIAAGQKP
ncbi:MAG: hypothetical protein U5J78_04430 [Parasphingorhabdus sp.]|nr:hypothetical protein [Parasphingorhabdus sp.]